MPGPAARTAKPHQTSNVQARIMTMAATWMTNPSVPPILGARKKATTPRRAGTSRSIRCARNRLAKPPTSTPGGRPVRLTGGAGWGDSMQISWDVRSRIPLWRTRPPAILGRRSDCDGNAISELQHAARQHRHLLARDQLLALLTVWMNEHCAVGGVEISRHHLPSLGCHLDVCPTDVVSWTVQCHEVRCLEVRSSRIRRASDEHRAIDLRPRSVVCLQYAQHGPSYQPWILLGNLNAAHATSRGSRGIAMPVWAVRRQDQGVGGPICGLHLRRGRRRP